MTIHKNKLRTNVVKQRSLENRVLLVTGASRGLGAAIVKEALTQGAKKVYITARNVEDLDGSDLRLVKRPLELGSPESIAKCHAAAGDVDLLINNAGLLNRGNAAETDIVKLRQEIDVNFFGALEMMRKFAPTIALNGGGNIANIISICAYAGMPSLAGYSASKAALHSVTQSMRMTLKRQSIFVHGVYPGPLATQMNEGLEIDNIASCETAAQIILEGITQGKSDIYPDPKARKVDVDWHLNPDLIESEFSHY